MRSHLFLLCLGPFCLKLVAKGRSSSGSEAFLAPQHQKALLEKGLLVCTFVQISALPGISMTTMQSVCSSSFQNELVHPAAGPPAAPGPRCAGGDAVQGVNDPVPAGAHLPQHKAARSLEGIPVVLRRLLAPTLLCSAALPLASACSPAKPQVHAHRALQRWLLCQSYLDYRTGACTMEQNPAPRQAQGVCDPQRSLQRGKCHPDPCLPALRSPCSLPSLSGG